MDIKILQFFLERTCKSILYLCSHQIFFILSTRFTDIPPELTRNVLPELQYSVIRFSSGKIKIDGAVHRALYRTFHPPGKGGGGSVFLTNGKDGNGSPGNSPVYIFMHIA